MQGARGCTVVAKEDMDLPVVSGHGREAGRKWVSVAVAPAVGSTERLPGFNQNVVR